MGFEEVEAADPHGLGLFYMNTPGEFVRAEWSGRSLLAMA